MLNVLKADKELERVEKLRKYEKVGKGTSKA
jgi:hypothetical protein